MKTKRSLRVRKKLFIFLLLLAQLSFLISCGTQDYGDSNGGDQDESEQVVRPVNDSTPNNESNQNQESPAPNGGAGGLSRDNPTQQTGDVRDSDQAPNIPGSQNIASPRAITDGYLWYGLEWVGVSEEAMMDLKDQLRENENANDFRAFGATVIGGAVLGLVMRISGSLFFGKPIESEMSHWFWHYLDKAAKNMGQGAGRGALFAGGC